MNACARFALAASVAVLGGCGNPTAEKTEAALPSTGDATVVDSGAPPGPDGGTAKDAASLDIGTWVEPDGQSTDANAAADAAGNADAASDVGTGSDAAFDAQIGSDSNEPGFSDAWSDIGTSEDVATPAPGTPCDDGNACTAPDAWSSDGVCTGPTLPCDDGRPCTQDHCYEKVGCTHVAMPGCGSPCPECPTALGFECDTTVSPAICVRPSTHESYVPSGLFWFGFNDKALASPALVAEIGSNEKVAVQIFLPGFIMDDRRVDSRSAYFFSGYLADCETDGTSQDCLDPGLPLVGFFVTTDLKYCESLGKRLCWETEWHKTAAGGCAQLGLPEDDADACREERRLYPWGDQLPIQCLAPPPYSWYYNCGLPQSPDGQPVSNRSLYGPVALTGKYGEGVLAVVYVGGTAELVPLVGSDGVAPPPGFATSGSQTVWTFDNPQANGRGDIWEPSYKFEPMADPTIYHWGFRCCTSVDPSTLVLPGEAPPWPPELQ